MKDYQCSCYVEYPNQSHKNKNGTWKCVDKYEKCEGWKPNSPYGCKTHCRRKEPKTMSDIEIIESALSKLKYQKENFGFMDRFTVDENWVVRKVLEEHLEKLKEQKNDYFNEKKAR